MAAIDAFDSSESLQKNSSFGSVPRRETPDVALLFSFSVRILFYINSTRVILAKIEDKIPHCGVLLLSEIVGVQIHKRFEKLFRIDLSIEILSVNH